VLDDSATGSSGLSPIWRFTTDRRDALSDRGLKEFDRISGSVVDDDLFSAKRRLRHFVHARKVNVQAACMPSAPHELKDLPDPEIRPGKESVDAATGTLDRCHVDTGREPPN
jgi:hypothetical protein